MACSRSIFLVVGLLDFIVSYKDFISFCCEASTKKLINRHLFVCFNVICFLHCCFFAVTMLSFFPQMKFARTWRM